MSAELAHGVDRFTVTHKLTLMVNRYEIRTVAGDKSLLRLTWHVEASGIKVTGSERGIGVAIGRRIWEATPVGDAIPSPFRFHFDFIDSNGEALMTSERGRSLRDRYFITLPGARLDGRVAAAMTVALDALQSR
jgi:hypothetical protein